LKVKDVIEQIVSEPSAVSPSYIESILLRDKQLGKGFFGTVYKGKDSVLGRSFAIKAINKDILKGGNSEDIQQAMQTFQREQEVCTPIFP
jgi:serine/threonine protein kinase